MSSVVNLVVKLVVKLVVLSLQRTRTLDLSQHTHTNTNTHTRVCVCVLVKKADEVSITHLSFYEKDQNLNSPLHSTNNVLNVNLPKDVKAVPYQSQGLDRQVALSSSTNSMLFHSLDASPAVTGEASLRPLTGEALLGTLTVEATRSSASSRLLTGVCISIKSEPGSEAAAQEAAEQQRAIN